MAFCTSCGTQFADSSSVCPVCNTPADGMPPAYGSLAPNYQPEGNVFGTPVAAAPVAPAPVTPAPVAPIPVIPAVPTAQPSWPGQDVPSSQGSYSQQGYSPQQPSQPEPSSYPGFSSVPSQQNVYGGVPTTPPSVIQPSAAQQSAGYYPAGTGSYPSPAPKKSKAVPLVIALVAVLLIGGGVAAFTLITPLQEAVSSLFSKTSEPIKITGNMTGTVGQKYQTRWFDFTIESMRTASSYEGQTADAGNTLLIVHISEKSTFATEQPYGTFDWVLDDSSLDEYIVPLDPYAANMMPREYTLKSGESVTYDVVFVYPSDLPAPVLLYREIDSKGDTSSSIKFPVK